VEVTVKKLRKPAIVYKIAPPGNSELAGRKIVDVANVAKCWRQKLSQSTFHLVSVFFHLVIFSYDRLRRYSPALSLCANTARPFIVRRADDHSSNVESGLLYRVGQKPDCF